MERSVFLRGLPPFYSIRDSDIIQSRTVLWRKLYPEENRQFYGALFGGITALSSLAVGAFGLAPFLSISNVTSGDMAVLEALLFLVLLLPIGFFFAIVATGWLVLPLGVFGGWYHERAKVVP